MTRDDIIRMAREAGFVIDEKAQQHQPNCVFHTHHMVDELLARFAALVAAAEREACADLCDLGRYLRGWECAASIRARSQS